MWDVVALTVLLVVFTLPLTGFLFARWGFEEADHHSQRRSDNM
jgi:hypothetical protein